MREILNKTLGWTHKKRIKLAFAVLKQSGLEICEAVDTNTGEVIIKDEEVSNGHD